MANWKLTLCCHLFIIPLAVGLWSCSDSDFTDSDSSGGDADTTPKVVPSVYVDSTYGELRVRKRAAELSAAEIDELVDAFAALKETQSSYEYPDLSYLTKANGEPYNHCDLDNAYDYFPVMHMGAFDTSSRAHMSPFFLPWHREYLLRVERELQRVSGNPNLSLPYWDWPDDDEQSVIFSDDFLGGDGDPGADHAVMTGRLVDLGFRVNMFSTGEVNTETMNFDITPICLSDQNNETEAVITPYLTRDLGNGQLAKILPTRDNVNDAIERERPYDSAPYNTSSEPDSSFRTFVEGFDPTFDMISHGMIGLFMHGKVHRWVAGDGGTMGQPSSPNDPIFFLHHSNVDRIWAEWQDNFGNSTYPSDWLGVMPFWEDNNVKALEMLDHRRLGYIYSSQLEK